MRTFIEDVLDDVLNNATNISTTTFILPSRRAGSFLRNTLSRKLTKSTFAPKIYSIEEFVELISGLKTVSQSDQLFAFYKAYKEVHNTEEKESLSTFMGWAQTVLGDFNEIDRHLIESKPFFTHINAIQDLNHWSTDNPTVLIKNYLNFWKRLHAYYTAFSESLLKERKGHQGLIYRKATEEIEFYKANNPDEKHVFLGFNALNKSEEYIIQALLANGNSEIYWDTEEFFMRNIIHDASMFLRKHKKEWPYFKNHPFKHVSNNYTQQKSITATAVAQNVHQAKHVGNLLSQYNQEELNNTAIILGDESLLLPILNALPNNVTAINITMGLPLRHTPVASFFENLFHLKKQTNENGCYYKNVLQLLHHPISKKIIGQNAIIIVNHIIKNNILFVKNGDICAALQINTLTDSLELLFIDWEDNPSKAITNCLAIVNSIKNGLNLDSEILLTEYVFGFYKAFNKLAALHSENPFIEDVKTLTLFYRESIATETIDIQGDPYEGLQIMGMLESRLLDYKNIIITSVNEGILPSGKSNASHIPYDLKVYYGLPTYRDKDAVYTYHFYRLLHRSENLEILYTTATEGLGSSEKSRLLLQLEIEGPHVIKYQVATPEINSTVQKPIVIAKSPEIIKKIEGLFEYGISPSAIGVYLRNPIDFYYKYILGIKNTQEVEETIAANTMGTVIHNVLEKLYTPYIQNVLSSEIISSMQPLIKKEVQREFKAAFGSNHIDKGQNLIIYKVICRYLTNFLEQEKQLLTQGDVVAIQSLEQEHKIPVTLEGLACTLHLKGTADRIETRNGELRVIDYKTGTVAQKDLTIKEWDDLLAGEGQYEKAFQVLMYAYMAHKKQPLSFPISAGIISLKKLKNGYMPFKFAKDSNITEETLLAFEGVLSTVLLEIYNPDIPFEDSGFSY